MNFLLRLLRAVWSLGDSEPAAREEAPPEERPAATLPAPEKTRVPEAGPEPRPLTECSLKLRPMDKSRVERRVRRGGFTRVFVNTKERLRRRGVFAKDAAPDPSGLDKGAVPPGMPVKDLRARRPGIKRRPQLVLLDGGDDKD